jgi:hypothetical protein
VSDRTIIQITVAFEGLTLEETAEATQEMERQALQAIHWKLAEAGRSTEEASEVMTWYGANALVPRNLKDGTVAA